MVVEIDNEKQIFDFADARLLTDDIDNTPLASRAWVLQERLLAPRNLQSGFSQLFWECRTKYACETFPNELPKEFCVHDSCLPKQNLWKSWNKIFFIYSGIFLTYRRDKLIAIAGIARRIQEQTGDEYFAGLWRKDLQSQLCWWVRSRDPNLGPQHLRLAEIPSWPWAAVDAQVLLHPDTVSLLKSYIKLVDVVVTLDGSPSFDPFGSANGRVLTISSKFILRCTVRHRTPDFSSWVQGQTTEISISHKSIDGQVQ